jgi:C1A family cysteine protease
MDGDEIYLTLGIASGANTLPGQVALKKPLPLHVDLRDKCPPVYDQGELGSCTANGVGALLEYEQMRQGDALATPSRLFIYYGERAIEGSVSYDSGAQVRDGLKVVSTLGAPPETLWPYDIARFTQKPPTAAYTEAAKHRRSGITGFSLTAV